MVIRTGTTEVAHSYPAHVATTLQCFPRHIVFSDYENNLLGEQIINVVDSVNVEIVAQNDDFDLYQRLIQDSRAGLAAAELAGVPDDEILSEGGHANVPGWKLDKWKFLPMVNRTLYEYPHMKWYVFIEADTAILIPTLLAYLPIFDPAKSSYSGFDTFMGDVIFAHGRSGFIASKPALRTVVDSYGIHKTELEALTDREWAGDFVLGKAFHNAGVPFTGIWPLTHGESTGHTIFAGAAHPPVPKEYMQVWCYPAATYHHMAPDAVESLWKFEQEWLRDRQNPTEVLRHKDVFKHYVMPQMTSLRMDWDNMGDREEIGVDSIEQCREVCKSEPACKQYSYDQAGRCKTLVVPRLGIPTKGAVSGWLEDRIAAFEMDMAPCGNEALDTLPGDL